MATAMRQIGKRLVVGALVLLIAGAVGGALGSLVGDFSYLAYLSIREPGSVMRAGRYFVIFTSEPMDLMPRIWGGSAIGAIAGIFLGVWVLRRLFRTRPTAEQAR